MVTDEALNSFRAVGMVDFLSTEFQTTPLEWLQESAWWLKFSFHDHPLLSFSVQHFFFRLFGDTVTVARLPFALFGVISVWLLYGLVKEITGDEKIGLLSALALAVGSLSVWISRIALQEAMVIALGLLIVWLGLRAMREQKYWYWFGLALGMGMMTKYTVVVYWFIVFISLLIYSRKSLRQKEFWFAHLIALVIFMPVILYNIGLYREFGHFDLQFSYLFGQSVPQWELMPGKPQGTVGDRFISVWPELARTMSPAMIVFSSIGVWYWLYGLLARRQSVTSQIGRMRLIGLIGLISTIALISMLGPGVRFLPMMMPWAAMAVAALVVGMWGGGGMVRKMWLSVGVLALLYELGFSVNSNLLILPNGPRSWTHSQVLTQGQWWGYNELEKYLHEKFDGGVTTLRLGSKHPLVGTVMDEYHDARSQKDLRPLATLLVVDVNMNWFPRVWYINRRMLYQALPAVTADDFLKVAQEQGENYYRKAGFEEFVFIKAEDTFRATTVQSDAATELARTLEEQHIDLIEIKRPGGEVAFKVYEF